jgi:ubiquinone/menaquinone biosynthesis C-methylase UbiE
MERMPSPEDMKQYFAHFFDRAADVYDAVDADFFTPIGQRLIERASLSHGDHVLDLGTGRGAALLPALAAVGPDGRVDGLDLSSNMVESTTADLARLGITNATIQVGDAEHPPSVPGGYDAITAALLVFFLPDARSALRNWRALLKPDGRLAFSAFAFGDDRWADVYGVFNPYLPEGQSASQLPPEGWYSTDDGTAQALAGVGFRRISMTTESIETRFRDPEHWLTWTRSHGGLITWDAVPDDAVADVEAQLTSALTPLQHPDGSLSLITGVRYTTAHA